MRTFVIGALSALAFASPAAAAGFHADIHGGWDNVSVAGGDDDGVAYGVALGYDLPVGPNMFVGVEGSVDDSSTKECVGDILELGDSLCAKTGRDLSLVARLGTNMGERAKLYVLAGYTNARLKLSYTDSTGTVSDGENGDGVRAGAGLQLGLGSGAFAKAEYRYSNYENDFSRHQVLVGLGYEF